MRVRKSVTLKGIAVEELLAIIIEHSNQAVLDFDLTSKISVDFTGYTKEQISQLATKYITSDVFRKSKNRSKANALGMYLVKLKSALINKQMTTLFGVKSKTIKKTVALIREELYNKLVPERLGFKNITRKLIEEHMSDMARALHLNVDLNV